MEIMADDILDSYVQARCLIGRIEPMKKHDVAIKWHLFHIGHMSSQDECQSRLTRYITVTVT